ncbi:MAG: membrane dipeptidase [Gemmatimonadetes bacterium]|nr:membrane dipeptidase [Gemmatimonadota bacterium]
MKRRDFVRLAGIAALTPGLARVLPGAHPVGGLFADRWPGYDNALVIDALAGPIQFNIPQERLPLGEAALSAVRRSGITALNLTVNDRPTAEADAYQTTRAKIVGWQAEVDAHPELFTLVTTTAELRGAKSKNQLGVILGFQDGVPFEDDLGRLDEFYGMGVRIIQLTYNVENKIGTGCLAPTDAGLTQLGREAVARMDDLGMLVDLSHCGPQTTLDGIAASTRPVSITHSGCRAVYDHPRSKDDATLKLLADRGGVVGIYLMPFLNASGPPSAAHVIEHIEHALDVCGEDHVGIGSDQGIAPLDVSGDFPTQFDAVSAQRSAAGIAAPREDTIPYVPDLNHPRRLETIADLMAGRGHGDRVIEKVLGANFVRLFGEVWR